MNDEAAMFLIGVLAVAAAAIHMLVVVAAAIQFGRALLALF